MLISQAGYYKGIVLDGGVGESSGGFPQCNLALKATEVYDPETDSWLPANPEADEINYYGTLMQRIDTNAPISQDNLTESANAKQLKKITGWDGASLVELATHPFPGTPIQFRVEPNTYNQKTTLQVSWIDEPGASPVRGVRKLDADGVKALQAKYAGVLASTKAPKKAVSANPTKEVAAPATATAMVVPAMPALNPVTTTRTETERKADLTHAAKAAEGLGKYIATGVMPSNPPALPKRAGRPAGKPVIPKTNVGKCTADEAWAAVSSLKRDNVTDEALTTEWTTAIQTVTGDINTAEEKITPENWFQIKELVLAKTAKV